MTAPEQSINVLSLIDVLNPNGLTKGNVVNNCSSHTGAVRSHCARHSCKHLSVNRITVAASRSQAHRFCLS